MNEDDIDKNYVLEQRLESGAKLRILIFEPGEVKLIFKYKYCQREDSPRAKPTLINEIMLEVNYMNGWFTDCLLSMHIIVPSLLGKQFAFGADISPGAKTYIEYACKFAAGVLRVTTVQVGAQPKIVLKEPEEDTVLQQLTQPPFPLFNWIHISTNGMLKIPFLHNSGEKRFFEFQSNILRHLM
jgi:hypothetical protein